MTNTPKATMTADKMPPTHISISLAELKRAVVEIIGNSPLEAEHYERQELKADQRQRLAQWLGEMEEDEPTN